MPVRSSRATRTVASSPEPETAPRQNSDSTVVNSSSPVRRAAKLVMHDMVTKKGRSRRIKKRDHREKAFQLSRSIRRNICLWSNIPQAVNVGRAIDTVKNYEEMDPTDELYDEENKKIAETIVANSGDNKDTLLKVYRRVTELFHRQREYIEGLSPEEDSEFWREVNDRADAGRNDDTGKLKDHAHKYVLKTGVPSPSLHGMPKAERGTSHPQIKLEIVPMSTLHKHGDGANFDDMLKAQTLTLTHNQAPAFLYDKEMWDPENMDVGLFRGHFPILILRQILFGPKAALAEPGTRMAGTRENNSEIAGLTKVTPEMIAYACVHARFYLCKQEQYSESDKEFNFKKFYYWIVKFLDEADEDWAEDTLAYWDEKVFGPGDDLVDMTRNDEDEEEASFAKILAAQKARKARANAPPAGTQTQPDSQYTQNAFASQA